MSISATQVRELRDLTGAGIMECKRALEESNGNVAGAEDYLKQQGLAKAEKKAGRAAKQGVVEPYIHGGGRIASLVELNCETDFVARTDDFRSLAHDVAMQVAAMSPTFVSADEITDEDWAILDREYESRDKALQAVSLLDQAFIKDPGSTIQDLVKATIGKLGENVVVRRFARFEVGAGLDQEESTE